MRAVVITAPGEPDVLQIRDVPALAAAEDRVLVEVRASALNRADLLQRLGRYPAPEGVAPDIPGLECAGVVSQAGPRARRFAVGRRVMGLLAGGGYAEQVVLPESHLMPVPDDWSDAEAAAFPEAYLTAFDALFRRLRIQSGETLLLHAIGSGVGLACLQLAKAAGLRVIGTSGTPEKLERARELGLDHGIHASSLDFAEEVSAWTKGRGVEAIVDFVGAPYWDRNIASLADQGRLVLVGLLGGAAVQADLGLVLRKRLTIVGTVMRGRQDWEKAALTRDVERLALPLARDDRVRPHVDRIFPLESAADAHRHMEANRNFGKIVLEVSKG